MFTCLDLVFEVLVCASGGAGPAWSSADPSGESLGTPGSILPLRSFGLSDLRMQLFVKTANGDEHVMQ